MGASPTGWDTLEVVQTAGQLWADLAIPGAGAGLVLHTDGTPESVANPSAKHLGHTAEGASVLIKPSYNEFKVDESPAAFKRTVNDANLAIAANLVQVEDMDIATLLLPGIGTKSTPASHIRITFGLIAVVYSCVALIWPRETAPTTKWGYVMIYRAANDEGLAIDAGRTKLAGSPVSFKGHAITSRAANDQYGQYDVMT